MDSNSHFFHLVFLFLMILINKEENIPNPKTFFFSFEKQQTHIITRAWLAYINYLVFCLFYCLRLQKEKKFFFKNFKFDCETRKQWITHITIRKQKKKMGGGLVAPKEIHIFNLTERPSEKQWIV